MKTILSIALTLMVTLSFAQNEYVISTTTARTLEEVKVTFWMQKTAGADLELGNSNFKVKVMNEEYILPIEINQVAKDENTFSRFDANTNYEASVVGLNPAKKLVSLNVYRSPEQDKAGKLVSESKTRLGSIIIPVNDPEATINLDWVVARGDVNTFDYKSVNKSELKYEPIAPIAPVEMPNTLNGVSISRMYPNPVFSSSNLILNAKENSSLIMTVHDMFGKVVAERFIQVNQGYNEVNLDFSDLPYGTYNASLTQGQERVNIKFVKQ